MRCFGSQSIYDLIGDNIVYRNLAPLDKNLPAWETLHQTLGLPKLPHPRKTTPAYAQTILEILAEAAQQRSSNVELNSLVFIGDTEYNDSQAFMNLCDQSGWQGMNFIGADRMSTSPYMKVKELDNQTVCLSSRWELLYEFAELCKRKKFPINQQTAVIVDLDKTLMGARGRNDKLIDAARVDAALLTARTLFEDDQAINEFQNTYELFNQPAYHHFTGDNQDYLVYLCLVVSAGLYNSNDLKIQVTQTNPLRFETFLEQIHVNASQMPAALREVHQLFVQSFEEGDPTPLKTFRRNELRNTLAKMNAVPEDSDPDVMLKEEIVLTYEVITVIEEWKKQGILIFGLSDKPDEASMPTPEMEKEGLLPIHKAPTHVLGMC